MTIDDLNTCDRAQFVDAVGWIFERSPWVAQRAWAARPFADAERLHGVMTAVVAGAPRDEQLLLLRAHPDLGARARMSDASSGEQTGAGLDRLAPSEFATLQRLNRTYREKFGFPFLFAVKGSTKHDVLEALERRLPHGHDEEFDEALRQLYQIARFRLDDLLA